MRIISGSCRGKKLFTPTENTIRPTADRAREALFNILTSRLQQHLSETAVIDIFSGTGAFGLEAASRGAKSVAFVDIDLTLTKKNVNACGFKNVRFIQKNATQLPPALHPFDLIFLDAPYNKGLTAQVLEVLLRQGYCHTDTQLIAETARDEVLPLPAKLTLDDERSYGAARFSFLSLTK